MSTFENVTVTREANIYFDGKVTSRKVTFEDGSYKTLGIMMPGEYKFGTEKAELMEILAGQLRYRLDGDTEWTPITYGQSFNFAKPPYVAVRRFFYVFYHTFCH